MGNQPSRKIPDLPELPLDADLRLKEEHAESEYMMAYMKLKEKIANHPELLSKVETKHDNSAFQNEYKQLTLPKDLDGYVVSFQIHQTAEIQQFFDKYGMVVISNTITPEECLASQTECWDLIGRHCRGFELHNPKTWDKHWPELAKLGILANWEVLSRQFFENRQNPIIHQAFATLFRTERLWVNIGRASVMRPTRDVEIPIEPPSNPESNEAPTADNAQLPAESKMAAHSHDEDVSEEKKSSLDTELTKPRLKQRADGTWVQLVDKPEWQTKAGKQWLHWDMNVFTGAATTYSFKVREILANRCALEPSSTAPYKLRVQGILALKDCSEHDGGFFCVPGGHKHVRGWAHEHRDNTDVKVMSPEGPMQMYLPDDDPMREHGTTCPIRAGSLLIWSSALPHCNFPNNSNSPRMVQYIKMIPVDDMSVQPLHTNPRLLPEDFSPSQLGRRLFGFDQWPSESSNTQQLEKEKPAECVLS